MCSEHLPLMDVDELPDAVFGVDDAFIDSYLKNIDGNSGQLLPTASLDQDGWLGATLQPLPSEPLGLPSAPRSPYAHLPSGPPHHMACSNTYVPPVSPQQQQWAGVAGVARTQPSRQAQCQAPASPAQAQAHAALPSFAHRQQSQQQARVPGPDMTAQWVARQAPACYVAAPAPHHDPRGLQSGSYVAADSQHLQPQPHGQSPQQTFPHTQQQNQPWQQAPQWSAQQDIYEHADWPLHAEGDKWFGWSQMSAQHWTAAPPPSAPFLPPPNAPRMAHMQRTPAAARPQLQSQSYQAPPPHHVPGAQRPLRAPSHDLIATAPPPPLMPKRERSEHERRDLLVKSASADSLPAPGTEAHEQRVEAGKADDRSGADAGVADDGTNDADADYEAGNKDARATKATGRSSRRKTSARKVTLQRKQNNRKAQARYREKRKAQAAGLEQRVEELTRELGALAGVQERASALRSENAELKQALQARQRASQATMEDNTDTIADGGDTCDKLEAEYLESVTQLQELKAQMRQALLRGGVPVDTVSPDQTLSKETAREMAELLAPMCSFSMQQVVLALKCPRGTVLKHRMAHNASHVGREYLNRWNRILLNLRLDAGQQATIVRARQSAHDKLRAVYNARIELNSRAVELMTTGYPQCAHDALGTSSSDDTVLVRMRAAQKYGESAAHTPMYALLRDLKRNLQEERKQFLQQHEVIVKQALRPLQAAVLYIQAETDPLLPMAVSNLVAAQAGVPGLPPVEALTFGCKKHEQRFMRPFMGSAGRKASSVDCSCEGCDALPAVQQPDGAQHPPRQQQQLQEEDSRPEQH